MRAALCLVLVCSTAGCPFGDDDGDGTNWVALAQYETAYKDAYCTYLARCGMFPDKATCLGANISLGRSLDPNYIAAVGAGRVIYNGGNVKACVDAIANNTCDNTDQDGRFILPACSDFTRGTLPAGGQCTIDAECISYNCVGGSTGTTCATGTCIGDTAPSAEPGELGQSCGSTFNCVAGAYCDSNTICTVLKSSGMACGQSTECAYGLGCTGTTGARACGPLPTEGQPCPDYTCRDTGLYCNTSTMTCAKYALPPATCGTSSVQCSTYYRCDTTLGQCAQGPTLGQSCSTTNRCFDAASFCDPATYTCVALKADGQPCNSDTQCMNDHCDIDVSPSVCRSPMLCF